MARLRPQDRTSCTSVVIKTRLRWGLMTPPSQSRDGTAMHAYVPLPHLASGWAVLIVAELGLRVHRWPPLDAFLLSQANHVPKDARGTRFFQTMSHSPRLTVAVPCGVGRWNLKVFASS